MVRRQSCRDRNLEAAGLIPSHSTLLLVIFLVIQYKRFAKSRPACVITNKAKIRKMMQIMPAVSRRSEKQALAVSRFMLYCKGRMYFADEKLLPYRCSLVFLGFATSLLDGNSAAMFAFAAIYLNLHARTLLVCRFCTMTALFACCPAFSLFARVTIAALGWYFPLYPPKVVGHVDEDDLHQQLQIAVPLAVVPVRRFRQAGNSCYLNTALQLLGTDDVFVQALRVHQCDKNCIGCSLQFDLAADHCGERFVPEVHHRSRLLEAPGVPQWSNGEQQDVAELLYAFHRKLEVSNAARPIIDAMYSRFGIVFEQKQTCSACGSDSDWKPDGDTADLLWSVTKWRDGDSVEAALRRELETHSLDAQATCEACNVSGSRHRSHRLRHLPATLWVRIDRTHYDRTPDGSIVASRRAGRIAVQDQISLNSSQGSKEYHLVAVGAHKGASMNSGHWVTWRPGWTLGQADPWFIDDDDARRPPRLDWPTHDDLPKQASLLLYSSAPLTVALPPPTPAAIPAQTVLAAGNTEAKLLDSGLPQQPAAGGHPDATKGDNTIKALQVISTVFDPQPDFGAKDPVGAEPLSCLEMLGLDPTTHKMIAPDSEEEQGDAEKDADRSSTEAEDSKSEDDDVFLTPQYKCTASESCAYLTSPHHRWHEAIQDLAQSLREDCSNISFHRNFGTARFAIFLKNMKKN